MPAAKATESTFVVAAEVPVTAEAQQQQATQTRSTEVPDKGVAVSVPTSGSETEVSNAPVPLETIKKQLVLEEISRSGEMGGSTYE